MKNQNNKTKTIAKMNKKLMVGIIMSSLSLIMIATLLLNSTTLSFATKNNVISGSAVIIPAGSRVIENNNPDKIEMKVGLSHIETMRGQIVTIPVTFTYNASASAMPVKVILGSNVNKAIFFTPTASKTYTNAQKKEFLFSNNLPLGVIDLYSLESFSKNSLVLSPGQTGTVEMYIHMPTSWPEEMLNQPVIFNVNHHFEPAVKMEPEGPISVEVTTT